MFKKYNELGAVNKAITLQKYREDNVLAVIQCMNIIHHCCQHNYYYHRVVAYSSLAPLHPVWRMCCHCCYDHVTCCNYNCNCNGVIVTTIFGISNFNSVQNCGTNHEHSSLLIVWECQPNSQDSPFARQRCRGQCRELVHSCSFDHLVALQYPWWRRAIATVTFN